MSAPTGPHRRHDPLRDSWVLVSAGRDQRPWQGQLEPALVAPAPAYDPACQLCPGNDRASGLPNPAYDGPFAFDNDFPALIPGLAEAETTDGLHRAEPVAGRSRVLCFSPRHDRSLGSLAPDERLAVVDAWVEETQTLGATHRWVQVFENRGAAMGASNPHPHGQVWAVDSLPSEAVREEATQRAHVVTTGRALLDDVADQERGGPLEVDRAGGWLAIVPYWASWPFETLVIAPAPSARLPDLAPAERAELAELLGRVVRRYDALFDRPFPYSMGWHQAPFGEEAGSWRLHAHVYPPLLRADARKFMVGYELLAEPQRDLTPEDAAERLRGAPA
jgi:UDPglucose--hexose-1-phosphate uridylyltransferase